MKETTPSPSFADRRVARRALKRFQQSVQGGSQRRTPPYLVPAAGLSAAILLVVTFFFLQNRPELPNFPAHQVHRVPPGITTALRDGGVTPSRFVRLGYHLYHLERYPEPLPAEERYRLLLELSRAGIPAEEAARLNKSWSGPSLTGSFSFTRENTLDLFRLVPAEKRGQFELGYRLGYLRYELGAGSQVGQAIARAGVSGQSDPDLGFSFANDSILMEGRVISAADFLRALEDLLNTR